MLYDKIDEILDDLDYVAFHERPHNNPSIMAYKAINIIKILRSSNCALSALVSLKDELIDRIFKALVLTTYKLPANNSEELTKSMDNFTEILNELGLKDLYIEFLNKQDTLKSKYRSMYNHRGECNDTK